MLKKIFFAGMILLAASCSNESELNEVINSEKATAPVTVRVNGFSITQEDFPTGGTRAEQTVASYTDVHAIDLAFYAGETEVYKTTQLRSISSTYTTFGEFSCNLPIGTYTMVVVGRGNFDGDVFTLTSPTAAGYTSERARETFCATQSVTVTSTTPLDLEVTLNRIVAMLKIISTDNASSGVAKIRTTYGKGSKSFNPTSGLATDDNGFSLTNNANVMADGKLGIYSFVFLASNEETMTITIEALDGSNNVLFTKVVPNVALKRNRKTTLSGAIFTANASSAAFSIETGWLEDNTVNF